jgi:hypothetical protein
MIATMKIPSIKASVLLLVAVSSTVGSDAQEFQAGFATADITPPFGWRRAGSYTELISTGVHDPLFAKAMVISQGDTTVAVVGNDLCSVPRELTDRARQLAREKTGIPVANIVITATHTHGGPEYYGPLRDFLHARALRENAGKDPREPIDYQGLLVELWAEVIVKAHAARKPAKLSVVVPQQHGLAFNRRFLMKDGSTGWNPGKLNTNIFSPARPHGFRSAVRAGARGRFQQTAWFADGVRHAHRDLQRRAGGRGVYGAP